MSTPTALVTGASRGIGRAVATELARRGWEVLAGMRRPDGPEPGDLPDGVRVVRLDVDDPDPAVIPDELQLLVNNAGVDTGNLPVEVVPTDEWRRVFATNVFGLAEVTRLALPALRAGAPSVVCNVTSAGLAVPVPFFGVYRASKAAVSALSETLATELAPLGVRVVEVLPGPVDTDMLAAVRHRARGRRRGRLPPAGRAHGRAPAGHRRSGRARRRRRCRAGRRRRGRPGRRAGGRAAAPHLRPGGSGGGGPLAGDA